MVELLSLTFLYLFLPLSLLCFLLTPVRLRPLLLLLLSLLFYLLAQPEMIAVLLSSIVIDYALMQILIHYRQEKDIGVACALLSGVKSVAFILYSMLAVRQGHGGVLGVMIFALSGTDCVCSAFRHRESNGVGMVSMGLLCSFFPRLWAGPLMPSEEFIAQLPTLRPSPRLLLDGFGRLMLGAVKVLLLDSHLGTIYGMLCAYAENASILSQWCMLAILALQVYYRFSGYCDMARGIGALFGLRLPQNFYYPYQSLGIQDFFQRFNSTFWSFLQRTLYPVLNRKQSKAGDILATLVMGVLMGLWFGAEKRYIAWGLGLATVALLERYMLSKVLGSLPILLRRACGLVVVLASFSLMAGGGLQHALQIFFSLFGLGVAQAFNYQILYLLLANWGILLLAVVGATSLCSVAVQGLRRVAPTLMSVLALAVNLGLLVIVTALLI